MSELTQLKARWLVLHNDTFCSLEIAEHFIATIASQKLSTEIEQPGDFEYAYDEFIKLARKAADEIAAVRPSSASKGPTEADVERVAKAIFFDQCNIMHDHEKNWGKANQVVWKSGARAALGAMQHE